METNRQTKCELYNDHFQNFKVYVAGLCSEERSMISPDYARNFICDNILGITQRNIDKQTSIFDFITD